MKVNFGGTEENVTTREEYPLEKAVKLLERETVAVLGLGPQGEGQGENLKDNGVNIIRGLRKDGGSWKRALELGYKPGVDLFEIGGGCSKRHSHS